MKRSSRLIVPSTLGFVSKLCRCLALQYRKRRTYLMQRAAEARADEEGGSQGPVRCSVHYPRPKP